VHTREPWNLKLLCTSERPEALLNQEPRTESATRRVLPRLSLDVVSSQEQARSAEHVGLANLSEVGDESEEDLDDHDQEEPGSDDSAAEELEDEELEEADCLGARGTEVTLEEDVAVVRSRETRVDEDDMADFDKEFQAMMQESIGLAKMIKGPTFNMPPPSVSVSSDRKAASAIDSAYVTSVPNRQPAPARSTGAAPTSMPGSVAFKVLVKKGGKQHTKELQVPKDSAFVLSTQRKEEEAKEERSELKRLVLDYHERDEDDLSLPSLKSMSIHQPTIRTNINSYGGGSYGNEVPGNHINSQSYGLNSRGNQGGRGSRRRR